MSHRTPVAAATFVVLFSSLGCGAESIEPRADAEVEADEAELTSITYYDCRRYRTDEALGRIEVGISATKLRVTDVSKDAIVPGAGRLDRSYAPTPAYAGSLRFTGFEEMRWADVFGVEVVVSPDIKERADRGNLWIRMYGGGGGSTKYSCTKKPKRFKVSTLRNARLACSLKPLACTHDNPPGDTCLADLFVYQTSREAANLRLSYLDHFGVQVSEREENMGGASDLARTSKKFEGAWGDYALDLSYRAGVTYTGALALPDGRSAAVQCNDLAMFD